jgi:hypothetical protein
MRISKVVWLLISVLVFGLIIGGCSLFPSNKTRPAPVRPRNISNLRTIRMTPKPTSKIPGVNRRILPAPSKRIRGLSSISQRSLLDRITRIQQAATRGNWSLANRETNTLGLEMSRFRPSSTSKGRSLREMANFDAMYVKIQADCRLRNRMAVIRDAQRLKAALSGMRRTA